MLTLYYKPTCHYSQAVLGEAEVMGISFNLKDVSHDAVLQDDLMRLGGKSQTPYLIDEERGVSLYESQAIINYLHDNYNGSSAKESFGGLRIHKSEEACDTCQ